MTHNKFCSYTKKLKSICCICVDIEGIYCFPFLECCVLFVCFFYKCLEFYLPPFLFVLGQTHRPQNEGNGASQRRKRRRGKVMIEGRTKFPFAQTGGTFNKLFV